MTVLNIFFHYFSEQIRLDISCKSSARQRIHMKHQALFLRKNLKVKKTKKKTANFMQMSALFADASL